MAGWIKIYRELADHWLAESPEKLGWWVILLMMAAHEDKKKMVGNEVITLKKGQVIASLSYLAERWKTNKTAASRFIEILENETMVEREVRRKVTIITICNYESYQEKKRGKRNDVCNENETMMERSWNEIKEGKEDIYLDDNNKAHTHTREGIAEYAARYQQEGLWADVAMAAHLKIPEVQAIFQDFIREQLHNETTYLDYPDFKRHTFNYIRIKAEILRKQAKQNGNNDKQNQRRGIQVVANRAEDYQGPF